MWRPFACGGEREREKWADTVAACQTSASITVSIQLAADLSWERCERLLSFQIMTSIKQLKREAVHDLAHPTNLLWTCVTSLRRGEVGGAGRTPRCCGLPLSTPRRCHGPCVCALTADESTRLRNKAAIDQAGERQ